MPVDCVAHGCENTVAKLSQSLSNDQAAATLKFFHPGDSDPLQSAQITDGAKSLSADYIVTATEVQTGANAVEPLAGNVTPPGFFDMGRH